MNQPGLGVGVAIVREGTVLMARRVKPDKMGQLRGEGLLSFPGGKCEFGQTVVENMIRECYEETGIQLDEERLLFLGITDTIQPERNSHFVTIVFTYSVPEGHNIVPVDKPDEMVDWQWYDLNDLPPKEQIFEPTWQLLNAVLYHYNIEMQ